MAFEVKLQQFSGPLQLLLEIIERKELPITEVALAQVAEDYLKHIDAHDVATTELADFLIVASKLLLIKSQAILPVPVLDEEEDASLLAAQLRMYKDFVDASKQIDAMLRAGHAMYARERVVIPQAPEFSPPANATVTTLRDAFQSLMKRLEPFFALKQTSMERVVSVQERIREIRDAIMERSRMTFHEVVSGARNKVEVVVSFLALLELVKQRVVQVVQKESFHDITITHVD